MAVGLRFNFNQLRELDSDLEKSKGSLAIIARKVLDSQLRQLRREMLPQIPRSKGNLRRSFGVSSRVNRASKGTASAKFGFLSGKNISASTAIAANVLQAGGATPKKGKYLWIPLPSNRAASGGAIMSPRDLISSGGFVHLSKSGNRIAFQSDGIPAFVLKAFVRLSAPPLPIEARVERQTPEIIRDVQETIAQVIEAKKAYLLSGE